MVSLYTSLLHYINWFSDFKSPFIPEMSLLVMVHNPFYRCSSIYGGVNLDKHIMSFQILEGVYPNIQVLRIIK
jgi:hypothetical protein